MRTLLLTLAALSLSVSGAAQASDNAGTDAGAERTVRIQQVEMKGKPPFKRDVEVLEISDAAAIEESTQAQKSRSPKGRPPLARFR
ncbi:hypothetical protein FV139_19365 [Parahaliea maris]|uniref:Uncharacterized protein n=1 Tax=Parahaliea maris TaxID=2716870 RepID=A0A5C8ZQW3_9GAMM|nr:hypothetical protein [Parahaliea maris]TXS89887.1 hypothetical protein FV139_19365 [Parahaliea maris]